MMQILPRSEARTISNGLQGDAERYTTHQPEATEAEECAERHTAHTPNQQTKPASTADQDTAAQTHRMPEIDFRYGSSQLRQA